MILGIMQPYFFPYLGYFDLINKSDEWIIFDTVQYIRHGWINRNRILHPQDGWLYITAPVSTSRESLIQEVRIAENKKWKKRILGQLQIYKKQAQYYNEVYYLVETCLSFEGDLISEFNAFSLKKVCDYIGINFKYRFFSKMDLELGSVNGPGDWALRISQALNATEYINPPGGEDLFDKKNFSESNIKLTIRRLPPLEYECPGFEFIPNLSILDVLMWNKPGDVKKFLDEHKGQ